MTKTNKSYTKRIKVTRTGKLVTRPLGQCHYNGKMSGEERMAHRGKKQLVLKNKDRGRFLQD